MTSPIGRRRSLRTSPDAKPPSPRDWVAIILAFSLGTAINFITLAVMYDAVKAGAQLSENATQILVAAFGGIVGILGSYLGFRSGERSNPPPPPREGTPPEDGA